MVRGTLKGACFLNPIRKDLADVFLLYIFVIVSVMLALSCIDPKHPR
jgi:hypothetical protein